MPDSSVFAQDSSFTSVQFEWAGANALLIPSWEEDAFMWNMRRMPNAETFSLHPQWDFITGLSFFYPGVCQHACKHSTSFMPRHYLYTCIYVWYTHTHPLSHVLYYPMRATQKTIKPIQVIIGSNDIKIYSANNPYS